MTKYIIHMCWNGDKRQVCDSWYYLTRKEWEWDKSVLCYDIIDETDNEVWFDYGDND